MVRARSDGAGVRERRVRPQGWRDLAADQDTVWLPHRPGPREGSKSPGRRCAGEALGRAGVPELARKAAIGFEASHVSGNNVEADLGSVVRRPGKLSLTAEARHQAPGSYYSMRKAQHAKRQ